MARAASALPNAFEPSVTDILNEPIADGGLAFRFHTIADPASLRDVTRLALFEALGNRSEIERLVPVIADINAKASRHASNVIDFRTRTPRLGAPCVSFQIIEDYAPGRHSSGYVILEVIGPRDQIEKLATAARRLQS